MTDLLKDPFLFHAPEQPKKAKRQRLVYDPDNPDAYLQALATSADAPEEDRQWAARVLARPKATPEQQAEWDDPEPKTKRRPVTDPEELEARLDTHHPGWRLLDLLPEIKREFFPEAKRESAGVVIYDDVLDFEDRRPVRQKRLPFKLKKKA